MWAGRVSQVEPNFRTVSHPTLDAQVTPGAFLVPLQSIRHGTCIHSKLIMQVCLLKPVFTIYYTEIIDPESCWRVPRPCSDSLTTSSFILSASILTSLCVICQKYIRPTNPLPALKGTKAQWTQELLKGALLILKNSYTRSET